MIDKQNGRDVKKRPYLFYTDCVHSTAEKIDALVGGGMEITWAVFIEHVPVDEVRRVFPFYSYRQEKHNAESRQATMRLHIKDDYTVRFCRGKYDGKRAYYIVHSCIEYVFIKNDEEKINDIDS